MKTETELDQLCRNANEVRRFLCRSWAQKTYRVYLGDREWERVHGAQCVGTVQAESREQAYQRIAAGNWECQSHNAGPGYWLVEAQAEGSNP